MIISMHARAHASLETFSATIARHVRSWRLTRGSSRRYGSPKGDSTREGLAVTPDSRDINIGRAIVKRDLPAVPFAEIDGGFCHGVGPERFRGRTSKAGRSRENYDEQLEQRALKTSWLFVISE